MDNSYPWRDIYSTEAWENILQITGASNQGSIAELGRQIAAYHGVPKDELTRIDERRDKLRGIASKAAAIVKEETLDTNKDGKRKYDNRPGTQPVNKLGVWLASLEKRCGKKSEYLQTIKTYQQTSKHAKHSAGAAAFLEYVNDVQKRRATDTNMHLTSGNRMERLDPLHRGGAEFELFGDNLIAPTSNPLSKALCDWLDSMSSVPFFLWLENHQICLATPGFDGWSEDNRRVKKTWYKEKSDDIYLVQIKGGRLSFIAADGEEAQPEKTLDTSDARVVKGVVTAHGQYAFAWATDDRIYSAPHKAGKMHHSSFTRGYKVKAAGMWSVADGKVRLVDDNTGHYQTDAYHLYDFVKFLHDARVMPDDAKVMARTLKADPMDKDGGNAIEVGRFLSFYSDPAERQALKATVKTGTIRRRGTGTQADVAVDIAPAPQPEKAGLSKDFLLKFGALKLGKPGQ